MCGQGLAQNTLDASLKSFTHSLILPGHTEHACTGAGLQELLPGGLSQPARGSCSWGCWLGAESGPEMPAWGVGGDGRPSPWMLRPRVV